MVNANLEPYGENKNIEIEFYKLENYCSICVCINKDLYAYGQDLYNPRKQHGEQTAVS